MKKIFLGLLFFFLILPRVSFAVDNLDLAKARQDYVSATSDYRSSLESFLFAKSRFLTFKSLESEIAALESAKKMMAAKLELLKAYLVLIRTNLALETGILDYKENLAFVRLDNLITEIEVLAKEVAEAESLEEIDDLDTRLKTKFEAIKKAAFQALGLGKIRKFSNYYEEFSGQQKLLGERINYLETQDGVDLSAPKRELTGLGEKNDLEKTNFNQNAKEFLVKVDSPDPLKAFLEFETSLKNSRTSILDLVNKFGNLIAFLKRI